MKLIVFVIFLILSVTTLVQAKAASNVAKIDTKNATMNKESKIKGGEEIDITYVPSQVAILFRNKIICSGNIIREDVILSVAHCLFHKNIPLLKVRSGSKYYDKGGRVVFGSSVKIHSEYVHCVECFNFDIALLFLANHATALGIPASIISLWETGTVFGPGVYATVSGWGAIEQNSNEPAASIRRAVVPIVPWYACHTRIPFVSTYNICAGYSNGVIDACTGDSGAGLMVGDKLAGIHAFGSCGNEDTPSGYTSIPIFNMWIQRHLNE